MITQLLLKTNQSIRIGMSITSVFSSDEGWTIEDDPELEPLYVVLYQTDTPTVKTRINRDCVLAVVTTD